MQSEEEGMNFEELGQLILQAAAEGLGSGAQLVEARAKRHAPVRSIFAGTPTAGSVEDIGFLTIGEAMSERSSMVRAGLPPRSTASVTTREAPVWWQERRMSNAQALLDAGSYMSRKQENMAKAADDYIEPTPYMLSSRGASEVRTKRALFSTWGHQHIGGRLRDSIRAQKPVISESGAEAWVIAGGEQAPYARYQEFGTVKMRAHPFMRPAAEESREDVAALVAAAVRRVSRTGAGRAQINIVVRL
jgi:HK97 gp10 family phage protein